MINLPAFTFLCGPPQNGQLALITALCAQDDQLIRMDFLSPIHDVIAQLFPDTFPVTLEPSSVLNQVLPFEGKEDRTVESLSMALQDTLYGEFGTDFFGRWALRQLRLHDTTSIFKRVIFSDTTSAEDCQVFLDEFGRESCLAIHLGALDKQSNTTGLDCFHVWLATPEIHTRFQALELELNPNARRAKA